MTNQKPFSPSAQRNKRSIFQCLQHELSDNDVVFEFGSGTGQHICYFAAQLPDVQWQPSDLAQQLPGIRRWIADSHCQNILSPLELDLASPTNIDLDVSVCYSANTSHIISWELVQTLFKHSASIMKDSGKLCLYGPFMFDGKHCSDSNRQFDQQLRHTDSRSGIRDLFALNQLAITHGYEPARVLPMPSNNFMLIWELSKP